MENKNISTSTQNPYFKAKKKGRCFNGFEKDRGNIVHLVPNKPIGFGDWFSKAMCGTEPGFRGNGWVEVSDREVTCEKCLKKQNKIHPPR